MNSMAKPSSMCRTTRPCVLPTVTTTPIGGLNSEETPIAAPDCDRSITRHATLVPFVLAPKEGTDASAGKTETDFVDEIGGRKCARGNGGGVNIGTSGSGTLTPLPVPVIEKCACRCVFDAAPVPSRDTHLPPVPDRHRHASIIVATVRLEQGSCRGGIWRRRAAVSVKTRVTLAGNERPLMVVSLHVKARPQIHGTGEKNSRAQDLKYWSPGRRGDVTKPQRCDNNLATWLKGGRKPSLFIWFIWQAPIRLAAGW